MDKKSERLELSKVFGASVAHEALDYERPDFLIKLPICQTLGVEVTSVFSCNGAAKLSHMHEYSDALLGGTMRMHRADIGQFTVDKVVLQQENGTYVDTVQAIILQQPSPKDAWRLFWAQVQAKEDKIASYLTHCDFVDLIVSDPGRMLLYRDPEEFQQSFLAAVPKQIALTSPFREIHLITSTVDGTEVAIPLRSNLFAGDCLAFEELLKVEAAEQPWEENFLLLTACLQMEGHRHLKVNVEKEAWGLLAGAWEMHYSEDSHALRDWTLPSDHYPGLPVEEWRDNILSLQDKVQRLVKQRKELYAAVHLCTQADFSPDVK